MTSLKEIPLFSGCPEEDLATLTFSKSRQLVAGSQVFKEGEKIHAVWYLELGSIQISDLLVNRGTLIGEYGLVGNDRRFGNAIAKEPCTVLEWEVEMLKGWLVQRPRSAAAVFEFLSSQLWSRVKQIPVDDANVEMLRLKFQ